MLLVLNGGLAFGVRVVLIKEGLLVADSFGANWAIIAVSGVLPGFIMIWLRRPMLVCAPAPSDIRSDTHFSLAVRMCKYRNVFDVPRH